jgi:ubiquinone/menaquinone biosynthesis C-methylase UbiE
MKILDAAPPAPRLSVATKPSVATKVAAGTQRRRWQRHAAAWEGHAVAGLESVIEAVIEETGRSQLGVVVDIGSGGGALALRLAGRAERVLAVDVSPAMLETLEERAARSGFDNIELHCETIESFDLGDASVDMVVSNYALHHLLDGDKGQFVAKAARWLRPGGKLVIGDMMIGRGLQGEDRRILAGKARVLLARGPGGWWRVAKNAWRLYSRTVERPVPTGRWVEMLHQAGFVDVTSRRVVAEAAVVSGTRA